MHELAICQSLIDQLDQIAGEYPGKRITVVHLQIGPLSGVVPELLKDAFPIASAGTPAQDAELQFHDSQIQVHCPKCGRDSIASTNKLTCGHCGNWQTELLSGDELMLQQVELEVSDQTELLEGQTLH
jgi:hydrogenase nickel incorporation protein HypA/HybF